MIDRYEREILRRCCDDELDPEEAAVWTKVAQTRANLKQRLELTKEAEYIYRASTVL